MHLQQESWGKSFSVVQYHSKKNDSGPRTDSCGTLQLTFTWIIRVPLSVSSIILKELRTRGW